jgi:hypothetical protein
MKEHNFKVGDKVTFVDWTGTPHSGFYDMIVTDISTRLPNTFTVSYYHGTSRRFYEGSTLSSELLRHRKTVLELINEIEL